MIVRVEFDPMSWAVRCPCGYLMFWADDHTDVARCIAKEVARVEADCPICDRTVTSHDEPTYRSHRTRLRWQSREGAE